MSENLMDTSPGGENTQYESIHEFTKPHAKESGQLGDEADTTSTSTSTTTSDKSAPNSAGITPAEKIRYGQSIQQSGMGGKTEGGLGAGGADEESQEGGLDARAAQGYGEGSGVNG